MSNNSTPHAAYGLDQQGRLVRIEPGTSHSNISRLSTLEETLRRLSSNFRQDDLVLDSTLGEKTIFKTYKTFYGYLFK